MMKSLAVLFSLFISFGCAGQSIKLSFQTIAHGEALRLEKPFTINETDSAQVNQLKFYVSTVQFLHGDRIVFSELNSFHLIDFSFPNSTVLNIKTFEPIEYNSIKFNLGIDSTTNVSGAMGGDLDPTHGMYWTWQSGYINFKMEGVYISPLSATNKIQFHLGGYQTPFNNLQEVLLKTNSTEIRILLDLDVFIKAMDVSPSKTIMSPSALAVELSSTLAKSFKILSNE